MELAQLIRERRTIQAFTKEKVPDELVKHALSLSLWAPNHRLTFPWRYMLVSGNRREKLADLAAELKAAKKGELLPVAHEAVRATVLNPSHLLMLGLKNEPDSEVDKENFATLACSVQILSMVLWEQGVGAKWSTSGFTKHAKTYDILGISREQVRLEGCIFIGKGSVVPHASARPNLERILM